MSSLSRKSSQGRIWGLCSRSVCTLSFVKKFVGLAAASVASGIGLLVLSSPAQALVSCTGNSNFGSAATGSGANCGFLGAGDTFQIDVTDFFNDLGDTTFDATAFGIGIVTPGGTTVSFSNVQAVVTGTASTGPINNSPIAIWAEEVTDTFSPPLGDPAPFGTAQSGTFGYTASNFFNAGNAFRTIAFEFGETGFGAFGSIKASPSLINLTTVSQFLITGTLDSVGDDLAPNVISFAVGPAGIPTPGSTFGGFFTTTVPGPLPLAGVGAAFAWSRRLRRKQGVGSGGGVA